VNPTFSVANVVDLVKTKPGWAAIGAVLGLSATQLEAQVQPLLDYLFTPTVSVVQPDATTKCVVVSNYGSLAVQCTFITPQATTQPAATARLL
jgi:hypothetical protein